MISSAQPLRSDAAPSTTNQPAATGRARSHQRSPRLPRLSASTWRIATMVAAYIGMRSIGHSSPNFTPVRMNRLKPAGAGPFTSMAFIGPHRSGTPTNPGLPAAFNLGNFTRPLAQQTANAAEPLTAAQSPETLRTHIQDWLTQYPQTPRPLVIAIDPDHPEAKALEAAVTAIAQASHNDPDTPSIGILREGIPSVHTSDQPWEHGLEEHYSMMFQHISNFLGWSNLPTHQEKQALSDYKHALTTGQEQPTPNSKDLQPLVACAGAIGQMMNNEAYGTLMYHVLNMSPQESRDLAKTLGTIAPAFSSDDIHTNQAFATELSDKLAATPNWDRALTKFSKRFMEVSRFGIRWGHYPRKLPNSQDIIQAINGSLDTRSRDTVKQATHYFSHDLRQMAFKDNADAFLENTPEQAPILLVRPAHNQALNDHFRP